MRNLNSARHRAALYKTYLRNGTNKEHKKRSFVRSFSWIYENEFLYLATSVTLYLKITANCNERKVHV